MFRNKISAIKKAGLYPVTEFKNLYTEQSTIHYIKSAGKSRFLRSYSVTSLFLSKTGLL